MRIAQTSAIHHERTKKNSLIIIGAGGGGKHFFDGGELLAAQAQVAAEELTSETSKVVFPLMLPTSDMLVSEVVVNSCGGIL